MMLQVLGIFACYNRKEKTIRCLESLMQDNPNIEFSFIAVDDGSTDGTGRALSLYKNVQIILGDGQCYYSGGMRLGIKAAKERCNEYDWILFFNDDVEFFPGMIERLDAYAIERQEIIVGATCDERGKLTYGGVLKTSKFRPAFQTVMSRKNRLDCDTFNANCVLIPTHIFKSLPNIDPIYTHALGDFDYGLEAKRKGIPIVVSDFFVGQCVCNSLEGTWKDNCLSRKDRLKRKESPKGLPRREWFHFVKKNFGICSACVSSIVPYVKILVKRS